MIKRDKFDVSEDVIIYYTKIMTYKVSNLNTVLLKFTRKHIINNLNSMLLGSNQWNKNEDGNYIAECNTVRLIVDMKSRMIIGLEIK